MTPRISARALIVRDEHVLVASYRDGAGDWYVLPGGGQKLGETLEACLVREVEEETGLLVDVGRLRWVREFVAANFPNCEIRSDFHQVELTFECRVDMDREPVLGNAPDNGQTGLRWASIDELLALRFYPTDVALILNGRMRDRLYLGAV